MCTSSYCSRYRLLHAIQIYLGDDFTEPKGAPDHSRLRLVDMFTSLTHSEVKKDIIKFFSVPNSPLRIVICTVAYIYMEWVLTAPM